MTLAGAPTEPPEQPELVPDPPDEAQDPLPPDEAQDPPPPDEAQDPPPPDEAQGPPDVVQDPPEAVQDPPDVTQDPPEAAQGTPRNEPTGAPPDGKNAAAGHTAADWFLWSVIILVIGFVGFYLVWSGQQIARVLDNSPSLNDTIGRTAALNIAASTYVGFMLGGVIALIGCMITLRRVNAEVELATTEGPVPGSFSTNSAGLAIVFLGVALVGLSIVKPRSVEQQRAPSSKTSTPATSSSSSVTPSGTGTSNAGQVPEQLLEPVRSSSPPAKPSSSEQVPLDLLEPPTN